MADLTYDPTTGQFMTQQDAVIPQHTDPLWAWGETGLSPLGGQSDYGIIDPFMGIQEQYRNGQPIEAATWQQAVQQSLEGFMRANYGVDPIYNWDPSVSGTTQGSQFMLGTLQDLSQQNPSFFSTNQLQQDMNTGELGWGHGLPSFDPLMGLNPSDKLLAFEDTPLSQVEQLIGSMPGRLFNSQIASPYQATIREQQALVDKYNAQIADLQKQQAAAAPVSGDRHSSFRTFGGLGPVPNGNPYGIGTSGSTQYQSQIEDLQRQQTAARQAITDAQAQINQNAFVSLDQARNDPRYKDWNDFLFKLDIGEYAPPPEMVKATPQSVLANFMDTPAYRLAFGNDPNVLDPNLNPQERFRADPAYQFIQDEGIRQLQNQAASRGLLESGRSMRDIEQFAQGNADQNYQRWLQQNMGLFQDWTNQQAGIMQQGAQFAGPAASLQTGSGLAQGNQQQGAAQAGAYGQYGQNMSGIGSNISSLFGNQGVYGGSAYMNTGAAQASAVMQAASLYGQLQAANSAAKAQQGAATTGAMASLAGSLF